MSKSLSRFCILLATGSDKRVLPYSATAYTQAKLRSAAKDPTTTWHASIFAVDQAGAGMKQNLDDLSNVRKAFNHSGHVLPASEPLVSVIIPAQNVDAYVVAAVDSILQQSFDDFELLIIDDASTDQTWPILQDLAAKDRRIRLFRNEEPLGVPECMNKLVSAARGTYVARMDADDIAVPERLALQVQALRSGEVDLCGGAFIAFPAERLEIYNGPLGDAEIKLSLLFESTIRQPTVMMRRSLLLQEKYRTETIPTADYDLYVRLAPFVRFRNLPDILLLWRIREGQVTLRNETDNVRASNNARRMALMQLGIEPSDRQLELHGQIWTTRKPACWQDVVETETWLSFLASGLAQLPAAHEYLCGRWYRYCVKAAPYGLRTFWHFRRSRLHGLKRYSKGETVALFFMCCLRIPYASRAYWTLRSLAPSQLRRRKRIALIDRRLRRILGRDGLCS